MLTNQCNPHRLYRGDSQRFDCEGSQDKTILVEGLIQTWEDFHERLPSLKLSLLKKAEKAVFMSFSRKGGWHKMCRKVAITQPNPAKH